MHNSSQFSLQEAVSEVEGGVFRLAPITPNPRVVKVVYSNKPWLLRGNNHRLFSLDCQPLWFPENEMDLDKVKKLASGLSVGRHHVIVTNSLLVLRAFQMARTRHPETVIFAYVHWKKQALDPADTDYSLSLCNDLEALSVPQLDWEMAQADDYFCTHTNEHHRR